MEACALRSRQHAVAWALVLVWAAELKLSPEDVRLLAGLTADGLSTMDRPTGTSVVQRSAGHVAWEFRYCVGVRALDRMKRRCHDCRR